MTVETAEYLENFFAEETAKLMGSHGSRIIVCQHCGMQDIYQVNMETMEFTCTNCLTKYSID